MDWPLVQTWLASSYWSPGISLERVKRGAENSALVIGVFKDGAQVAFARVVSDKSRFAYICDVWVDSEHRGRGLARRIVAFALAHPDFTTVNWLLATHDAHGVYEKLGFGPLQNPERWMSKRLDSTGCA
jgi:GNAT superfamily N-acetyltransferase